MIIPTHTWIVKGNIYESFVLQIEVCSFRTKITYEVIGTAQHSCKLRVNTMACTGYPHRIFTEFFSLAQIPAVAEVKTP